VTVLDCEILGGDFAGAGRASQALKKALASIGVEAAAMRRALIATYEAEANVVIHARRGRLHVYFGPGQIDVEVEDEGPGIPDIELAMKEGYSTAPAEARELGFGAGMGLPNIRRATDRLSVQSTPGSGTRVAFTIRFRPEECAGSHAHSLRVDPARCRRCAHCLRACPTAALRLREAGPELLEHRCIDCTRCIAACATSALSMRGSDAGPATREGTTLVLPEPVVHQFGPSAGGGLAREAARRLGFAAVWTLGPWHDALSEATLAHATGARGPRPTISPVCPAVLALIAIRFPSLLPDVAPFVTPAEAARHELGAQPAAFIVLCPAERTTLTSTMGAPRVEVLAPAWLFRELGSSLPALRRERASAEPGAAPPARPIPEVGRDRVLRVTSVESVARVLERAEQGQLADLHVLELYACREGCFGSPLLVEDPHIARHRAALEVRAEETGARAVPRPEPMAPRPGLRLDPSMAEAIKKLARLDALVQDLPGRDCGSCGAPTCSAFAEDVVLGRALLAACAHRRAGQEEERCSST